MKPMALRNAIFAFTAMHVLCPTYWECWDIKAYTVRSALITRHVSTVAASRRLMIPGSAWPGCGYTPASILFRIGVVIPFWPAELVDLFCEEMLKEIIDENEVNVFSCFGQPYS